VVAILWIENSFRKISYTLYKHTIFALLFYFKLLLLQNKPRLNMKQHRLKQPQHNRRSIRLRNYDYGKEGMYFVTICCHNRTSLLGQIQNSQMTLNHFGSIAYEEWFKLPIRWPHLELGAFQIMPNHLHGIVVVHEPIKLLTIKQHTDGLNTIFKIFPSPCDELSLKEVKQATLQPEVAFSKFQWAARPALGQIVGAYKSIVATLCLKHHQQLHPGSWMDRLWQRNFYEKTIPNAEAYENITRYIEDNPSKWKEDDFYWCE